MLANAGIRGRNSGNDPGLAELPEGMLSSAVAAVAQGMRR
jgi:hypothetical protein